MLHTEVLLEVGFARAKFRARTRGDRCGTFSTRFYVSRYELLFIKFEKPNVKQ